MRPLQPRATRSLNGPHPFGRSGLTLIELLVVIGILGLLAALFMPATRSAREASRRTQCKNNLKQIGLALHNYHDVYEAFPPARTMTDAGRPLHGWRTPILPFLDQAPLYKTIELSQPWDAPVNSEAIATTTGILQCPSLASPGEPGETTYLGVVGPNSGLRPFESLNLRDITDGTSNTLLTVDGAHDIAVPWMAPRDGGAEFFLSFGPESDLQHPGGTQVLLADGAVRFISRDCDHTIREALITADGGETVGEF
jgi:prepilin-type N-terminal cleavage/methylation domain-containing protein